MPTPNTAPTSVWVVETGIPVPEAITTVVAAANSAANPRLGVSSVMFRPIVAITLYPRVASPTTMPPPPSSRIQNGSSDWAAKAPPFCTTPFTAARGPMALATSLEPWANAIEQAVNIMSTPNRRSRFATRSSALPASSVLILRIARKPMAIVSSPMPVAYSAASP